MDNPNYKNYPGIDCSEIAEDIYNASGGIGKIYSITGKGKGGYINGYEYGDVVNYEYHEVYSNGEYIFDPRFSNTPILEDDYFKALSKINPNGMNIKELK